MSPLLDALGVVVDEHLLAAHDQGATQFDRREPGELDLGDRTRGETQRHEGDVGDVALHAAATERRHVIGFLAEPVEQD